MNYWLVKTEPTSYSIQQWAREPNQTTYWDGVRNYQARNTLRDQMKLGDQVLVYHSSTDPPAVVGLAVVTREGYPDSSAWNPKSHYYDPDSKPDEPRWFMVDLKLEQVFTTPIPLEELRQIKALEKMELLRKGSRLSVQPVRKAEFTAIMKRVAG